jgi:DNA-binding transcriptional LysR family regulator
MFTEAGFAMPKQIIEAVSQMVVTRLLEETNHLAILTRDVAEYYSSFGTVRILQLELPCPRDPFGIVTRKDRGLSPAAQSLCAALQRSVVERARYGDARRRGDDCTQSESEHPR